jgi:uncharacterized membrane protein YkvA (DUF1232 family)
MSAWSGDLFVFVDAGGVAHISTSLPAGDAITQSAVKRYRGSGPVAPIQEAESITVGDASTWIAEKEKQGFSFELILEDDYSKHYSESSFWDKLLQFAKTAGREVVHKALILYYVGCDPATPVWAKGIIAAALGYFIIPLDAIPDITPFVGYADDLGALVAAMAAVASCITKEHIDKATKKAEEWFGPKTH